jgi:DNA-binding NarL/FixJ family response regulator
VLIADDHPGMRESVKRLLKAEFDVVAEFGDGQQVLAAVDELSPDVLVLDISMPRLGGIEAAEHLLRSGRPAKIVFLTMHDDADYAQVALATGALGYVVKPRMVADLATAVWHALKGQQFVSPTLQL